MSDKPEEHQQGARKHQPSFEEVLQGVQVEEPKPPAAPKKSAQPTLEEILESVRAASEPPKPQQQGKSTRGFRAAGPACRECRAENRRGSGLGVRAAFA